MSRLHNEVRSIEEEVWGMADLAAGMLRDGVRALESLDLDLAKQVREHADQLAVLDERIETHILKTLALESPMASDMRRLGAALKLITYVNRVGRYGYDIAMATRDWPEGRDHVAKMVDLRDMADKVETMLRMAVDAYEHFDGLDLDAFNALEEDVDALRYGVWRQCLSYMAESPQNIEPCAVYMMVARYLERAGDNVCKMVEKLHYAAKGERLLLP